MTTHMTAAPTTEIRPKKSWIWVGVGLIIAAIIAFGVLLGTGIAGIASQVDKYESVEANGSDSFVLESGTYTVYFESLASPNVEVSDDSGFLSLESVTTSSSYTSDGRTMVAQVSFTVDTAGNYVVTNNSDGLVSFGPALSGQILRTVFLPFGVGFVLGIVGLAIIVVTLIKRSAAKRRAIPTYAPPR